MRTCERQSNSSTNLPGDSACVVKCAPHAVPAVLTGVPLQCRLASLWQLHWPAAVLPVSPAPHTPADIQHCITKRALSSRQNLNRLTLLQHLAATQCAGDPVQWWVE